MEEKTTYDQLGHFVVKFQQVEERLTEVAVLMIQADDTYVRILVNELEFNKRVRATNAIFDRFIDLHGPDPSSEKKRFLVLMNQLIELGGRRNPLVHSTYLPFISVEGAGGLRRMSSKLDTKTMLPKTQEEDILPESLIKDLERLTTAYRSLEVFRKKIIKWQYPSV